MAEVADKEAYYWLKQIELAEGDNRRRAWVDIVNRIWERYLLEAQGLPMQGTVKGFGKRMVYNLLWENTQTLLPMLYTRLPEIHVSRRYDQRDPIGRMASTITERATTTDLEYDDLDDQAERCALDYALGGMGHLRITYESTVVNSRIPVRQEDREDGEPVFIAEDGNEFPADLVENDPLGMFVLDPEVVEEHAPLRYHYWRDAIIGPGRNWKEVSERGWFTWVTYLSKADAVNRFGKDEAETLNYDVNPYNLVTDPNPKSPEQDHQGIKLARINETWSAVDRNIYWTSPGSVLLLDKQKDFLELQGFYNTPRPLQATVGNQSMIPVPDYAQYRSQAKEMDDVTGKIEALMEEVRGGGMYDLSQPDLGTFLKNKSGGWVGTDNMQKFGAAGGFQGAAQQFDTSALVQAVVSLYEHRDKVKADADGISGMIDLFRGQETQKEETLGQSQIRKSMGGLRVTDKENDFQRYLRDALRLKAEVCISKFSQSTILAAAEAPSLISESPEVMQARLRLQSPEFQQQIQQAAQQNPQAAQAMQTQAMQAVQAAEQQQTQVIQAALQLLKSDRLRTFRLDFDTDQMGGVDELADRMAATDFVKVMNELTEMLNNAGENPGTKALAGEMVMFVVRRFRIGRTLEQKIEGVIKDIVTAPPPEPQPDPLMAEVERRAADDQATHEIDRGKNMLKAQEIEIDEFKARTDRMEAQTNAVEAAKEADRKALETANKILESDEMPETVQ